MRELCHRCHSELPEPAAGSSRGDEDAILFCPRCAAPQIYLPEHMRSEAPVATTTGHAPPPRPAGAVRVLAPSQIDWNAALKAGMAVAAIGVVLVILSLVLPAASILIFFWTVSAAPISLGLYTRLRPQAGMNARIGMRVGVAAGVLALAGAGVALSVSGVVLRFGTHSMEQSDRDVEQQRRLMQQKILAVFDENIEDKEMQAQYAEKLNSPAFNSPEFRAGSALGGLGFDGLFLLLLSAGSGAFAGRLRALHAARTGLRRGE